MSDWHSKLVADNLVAHEERKAIRLRARNRMVKAIKVWSKETPRDILREVLEGQIEELRRLDEAERLATRRRVKA